VSRCEFQRCDIGERRFVLAKRVPPHQFFDEELGAIVKPLHVRCIDGRDLPAPFQFQGLDRLLAAAADGVKIVRPLAPREFDQRAVPQIGFAREQQGLPPDLAIGFEQPLLFCGRFRAGDLLGVGARPEPAQLACERRFMAHLRSPLEDINPTVSRPISFQQSQDLAAHATKFQELCRRALPRCFEAEDQRA
jgi:hypothetical protein